MNTLSTLNQKLLLAAVAVCAFFAGPKSAEAYSCNKKVSGPVSSRYYQCKWDKTRSIGNKYAKGTAKVYFDAKAQVANPSYVKAGFEGSGELLGKKKTLAEIEAKFIASCTQKQGLSVKVLGYTLKSRSTPSGCKSTRLDKWSKNYNWGKSGTFINASYSFPIFWGISIKVGGSAGYSLGLDAGVELNPFYVGANATPEASANASASASIGGGIPWLAEIRSGVTANVKLIAVELPAEASLNNKFSSLTAEVDLSAKLSALKTYIYAWVKGTLVGISKTWKKTLVNKTLGSWNYTIFNANYTISLFGTKVLVPSLKFFSKM